MSLELDRTATEVAAALEALARDLRHAELLGVTPEAANERAARRADRLAEKLRLAVAHASGHTKRSMGHSH